MKLTTAPRNCRPDPRRTPPSAPCEEVEGLNEVEREGLNEVEERGQLSGVEGLNEVEREGLNEVEERG